MICRPALLAACGLVACAQVSAPMQMVAGEATMPIALDTASPLPAGASADWVLVARPDASLAVTPSGAPPARFVPDLRGAYLVELWIADGVADELAERYEVEVTGAPPIAAIAAPMTASVGATVAIDGSASASPEHRTLTYEWRLVARPRDSAATLAGTDVTTSLVPDVAGDYAVGLRVFDGDLWSADGVSVTITAQ